MTHNPNRNATARATLLLSIAVMLMSAGCATASSTGIPLRVKRGDFHTVGLDDARLMFEWRGRVYRTDSSDQISSDVRTAVAGPSGGAGRKLSELAVAEGWYFGTDARFLVVRVGDEYLIARPADALERR